MKKIGIIDFYIDEWHSNTYLGLFERASAELGVDYKVAYAWAELDRFENRRTTEQWCKENQIEQCKTIEELCEKSDNILILAPANPEKHLEYARVALRYGKSTYIDKTFTENLDSAKRIYEIANEYGTKIFSTSALRYAKELSELENVQSLVVCGGGRSLEEYIVHQLEMTVKLMGCQARSVRVYDREAQTTAVVDFGGKYATLNYSRSGRFIVDALVCGEQNSRYLPIVDGEYFYVLIRTILEFFVSESVPFNSAETMAVIALRDAILLARSMPVGSEVAVIN